VVRYKRPTLILTQSLKRGKGIENPCDRKSLSANHQPLPSISKPSKMKPEARMSLKINPHPTQQRPLWQGFLIVLGLDTLVVLIGALVLGNLRQISNLYFLSSIVLFIIAVIPIVTEVGSSAKIAGKAVKEGEKVGPLLKDKQAIFERSAQTTYMFGLAGLAAFILSMLSLSIG
jgi:hypothetical protein